MRIKGTEDYLAGEFEYSDAIGYYNRSFQIFADTAVLVDVIRGYYEMEEMDSVSKYMTRIEGFWNLSLGELNLRILLSQNQIEKQQKRL